VNRLLSAVLLAVPLLGTLMIVWAIFGWWPLAGHWLPENVNAYGGVIDHLWYLIFWITGAIFIGTGLLLAWLVQVGGWRADRRAPAIHGNHKLEVVWAVVPGLILIFLSLYQFDAWTRNKMARPTRPAADGHEEPIEASVRVVARQFDWDFWYPGPDGLFDTLDDVMLTGELHVPVDEPVVLQIETQDVLHSFFVPSLRVKQDIVSGMRQLVWFRATKPGDYEIACTELCGWGHYKMKAVMTVHSAEDYAAWRARAEAAAGATTVGAAEP